MNTLKYVAVAAGVATLLIGGTGPHPRVQAEYGQPRRRQAATCSSPSP